MKPRARVAPSMCADRHYFVHLLQARIKFISVHLYIHDVIASFLTTTMPRKGVEKVRTGCITCK